MERIEFFDRYIAGTLTEPEAAEFKMHLDRDEDFATDFKVYLITVRGICQEAEQDNIEFGHAMKSLTKEKLQSIIGKEKHPRIIRPKYFRKHKMWITSMAAMLALAIAIGCNLYFSLQNTRCDVVYNLAYEPIEGHRSDGEKYKDLDSLTNEQIEALIPALKSNFESDKTDSQQWHIDGMCLAMAYLRLHRKTEAVKVLETMAANTSDPKRYNRIIEQLK